MASYILLSLKGVERIILETSDKDIKMLAKLYRKFFSLGVVCVYIYTK